jgi:hypothetical protein
MLQRRQPGNKAEADSGTCCHLILAIEYLNPHFF